MDDAAFLTETRHRETEQHRHEEHLQHVTRAREGIEERVRDDVQQEIDRGLARRDLCIAGDRRRIERGGVRVESGARLNRLATISPITSAIVDTTSK